MIKIKWEVNEGYLYINPDHIIDVNTSDEDGIVLSTTDGSYVLTDKEWKELKEIFDKIVNATKLALDQMEEAIKEEIKGEN